MTRSARLSVCQLVGWSVRHIFLREREVTLLLSEHLFLLFRIVRIMSHDLGFTMLDFIASLAAKEAARGARSVVAI